MTNPTTLQFTEEMNGYFFHHSSEHFKGQISEFENAYHQGKKQDNAIRFILTILIDDLDLFIRSQEHRAKVQGFIEIQNKGKFNVEDGAFTLFTQNIIGSEIEIVSELHYQLFFYDEKNDPMTLFGRKQLKKENGRHLWKETTTLYMTLRNGHMTDPELNKLHSYGILKIHPAHFAKQLTTFKTNEKNFVADKTAIFRFLNLFAQGLWDSYFPDLLKLRHESIDEHLFPIHTNSGVRCSVKEIIQFDTQDGLTLQATSFRKREKVSSHNIVVTLHGLTTSSDMFIMPEHYNLVQYLLDNGIEDVWTFDWRGSGRYHYNVVPHTHTLDDVMMYDIPALIKEIKSKRGNDVKIHVICQCVGSIAFMGSLAAGLTTNIQSVISNSVSYTPTIGRLAKLKILVTPELIEYVVNLPFLSPKTPFFNGQYFGKMLGWFLRLFHRECSSTYCHMISFMWGVGHPAVYEHQNLHPITHRRLKDIFGATCVQYYRHIRKMVFAQESVSYNQKNRRKHLPKSYLQNLKNIVMPPTLFVSGSENKIFSGSNKMTVEKIKEISPEAQVSYHEFPKYGHQDIFCGVNSSEDIFPTMLQFIKEHWSLEANLLESDPYQMPSNPDVFEMQYS